MAGEWKTMTLGEAGVGLIDCDHRTPPAAGTGYPYIAIPQLKHGRLDLSDVRRITREDFIDWTRKANPQPYDVILSRRCNPGETAFVPPGFEGALGQNLVLLRADGTAVFQPFLRWLVRGPQWWEQIGKFLNVGAVFDSLRCADVPNFELRIPPLPEQRAIAHILGTLDDKIEVNRRMNETLEAMARALFKSWFVDFDPVRAKSARRDPGLPTEIAGLFPDSFEDSELGEIPQGWRVAALDEVATFLNGLALQKYPPTGSGDLAVIKIAELRQGHSGGCDWANSAVGVEYVVDDGDVLFSWSGSLLVEIWCGGKGALNQHLFKVTSGDFPKWFCFMWTRHHLPDFQAIASGKATTMGHIQRHHLSAAKVLVPSADLLQAMDGIFAPLITRYVTSNVESRTLAALRDTLLPKLISGELRVKSGERFPKDAL